MPSARQREGRSVLDDGGGIESRRRRRSIESNTTLSGERFLRPDGSEVSAVNSPVDGSNIPEEEPSPPGDDPEGGAALAGGLSCRKLSRCVRGRSSSIRSIRACRRSVRGTGVRGGILGTGACRIIRGTRGCSGIGRIGAIF